jgi:succinate-semialdehyde dehydrogenase / glutarate-semialdehyde dehydrogenase
MHELVPMYIDGIWRPAQSGNTAGLVNPASGEEFGRLSLASAPDIDAALAAAQRGFARWRQLPLAERCRLISLVGELLRERVDAIARDLTLEQGKTLAQARGEILGTADYFTGIAAAAMNLSGRAIPTGSDGMRRSVTYEPIGPVFAVSPWNLPAMMPGRKIANSLGAGCSVIVKPARETPLSAYAIAKCCEDAGIPPGVVNVICGDAAQISAAMIGSRVIRKVSFTGSTQVGRALAQIAGSSLKKITLELGGHAPVIVFDDADLEAVVEATVTARFANAGQSCLAPTRFFVQQRLYARFVQLFSARAGALRVGDGMDPATQMGPLTSARRLPLMDALVKDALQKGARLTAGGRRLERAGFFFAPTVLAEVSEAAALMSEEPFGPVTAIVPFADVDTVIERANATAYGLAAYIFTRDPDLAMRVVSQVEAGMVGINSVSVAHPSLPFGGVKDSGIGREGAYDGLLDSMVTKSISVGRQGV